MELVRSDTPDVTRCIASASVLASWHWPALVYCFFPCVLILLIASAVSLTVSVRAAAWFGVPVFLAWNVYVPWRSKSSRRNWVVAGCADRFCIRLSMHRVYKQEVIVLEASEIASMSIRTVEVFLHGPKPKFVEWLVIEPAQAVAENLSDHIPSFLGDFMAFDPSIQRHVAIEKGRLIIGWKSCHPALRMFLQQVARECPSVVIAPEERSELDLNGIWQWRGRGLESVRMHNSAGCSSRRDASDSVDECASLLGRYKQISFQKAAAYLAEYEQEEAGTSQSTVQR